MNIKKIVKDLVPAFIFIVVVIILLHLGSLGLIDAVSIISDYLIPICGIIVIIFVIIQKVIRRR